MVVLWEKKTAVKMVVWMVVKTVDQMDVQMGVKLADS
jgi:hypothetical protein